MAMVQTCSEAPPIAPIATSAVEAISTGPTGEISLASFNQLMLDHQDAAFNFAFYLVGDPDTAADIVQKAFISAYLNIVNFRGPSFRSWLFKIIKNASIDEFRSASYRRTSSLDAIENEEEWRHFPADLETPEQSVLQLEREQAIHDALNRLDEPFRTILVLVDIQGFDYEEAAQVAGVPVGTAKSRLSRARVKFRSEIERFSELF